jgi:HlyD family secretion protein
LAVIGFLAYPSLAQNFGGGQAQTTYQTEAAKKGDVSVTVGATGSVRANQSAIVMWQTSGKVASVNVHKGQQVAADAVLAELANSSIAQNILQAQVDLVNAQTALDKAINNNAARADAHLALIQAQKDLDDATKEAQSKLYQRASQETIDIARANLITANEALAQAESLYQQTQGAGQDSATYAAGLSQYAKARQQQQAAEYNLQYAQDLPDALSVEEVNAKLEQAKAKLLTAKQNWEKVKDGPDANEVQAAQVKVDIAQATLDLARLVAPFSGTITQVDSQVGDLVNSGKQAIQLDDLSRLLVEVEVSEVEINQVQVGQPDSMTFDAIPGQEYNGVVTDIAAFGSAANGTVNFTVTVEITDPSAEIKPGMTAAVSVIVNQLNDVLLVPSRAVRTVDGQRVVYVLQNNVPVSIEVTLGASANAYSQITSGDLQAGDLVVTNPSTNMLPFGSGGGPMSGGQP